MEDYRVFFGGIEEIGKHLNEGLTLYLVLRGEVTLEWNRGTILLPQNSCVLLNDGDIYGLVSAKANVLLGVTFRQSYIEHECPEIIGCKFSCCSAMPDAGKISELAYSKLKTQIARMVLIYTDHKPGWRFAFRAEFQKMMECLYLFFQTGSEVLPVGGSEDKRMQSILNYIRQNYRFRIGAKEIAEREFISTQYLSKLFRKKTGMTMLKYITRLRVEGSLSELSDTDHTILQIALNNGFSNEKAFSWQFREVYGETPAAYRKSHRHQQWKSEKWHYLLKEAEPQPIAALIHYLNSYEENITRPNLITNTITASEGGEPFPEHYKKILNIGNFNYINRKDFLEQLHETQKNLHFDYAYVYGFLSGSTETLRHGAYLKYGEYYETFDTLRELKLTPFFQITVDELLDKTHFASIEDALQRLHLILELALKKYGQKVCSDWLFEIRGTVEQIAEYGAVAAECIQKVIPGAKAGINLPFSDEEQWHGLKNAKKLFDISFVTFAVDQNEVKILTGESNSGFFRQYNRQKLDELKQFMASLGFPEAGYYLLDTNTLTGSNRTEAGEFHRSALIAEQYINNSRIMDGMGVKLNLYYGSSEGKDDLVTYGISLFLQKNIKRPAYFILQMMAACKGTLISSSEHYLFTKTGPDSYALLLYYPRYLEITNTLDQILSGKYETTYQISIRNLPPGRYRLRRMILDKRHGSTYKTLAAIDSTILLGIGEVNEYMTYNTFPDISLHEENISGQYEISQMATLNALLFYTFERLSSLSEDTD